MTTPVIDVYAFDIEGIEFGSIVDKSKYPQQSGFASFGNTLDGQCGVVKAKKDISIEHKTVLQHYNAFSCDKITNDPSQMKPDNLEQNEIDVLFEEVYNMNPSDGYWKTMSKEKIRECYVKLNKLMKDVSGYITEPLIDEHKLSVLTYGRSRLNALYNDGLVYNIICTPNTKVISIGDLHGSFHSLFRDIRRLMNSGIMDHQYKLNDDYMIIFTGDLIGYGKYSLFVLYMIFHLMLINKYRVYCIRGNHEDGIEIRYNKDAQVMEFNKNYHNSLYDIEISNIIDDNEDIITQRSTDDKDNFAGIFGDTFSTFPSAIVIEYSYHNRIWFSHGGIPLIVGVPSEVSVDFMNIILSDRMVGLNISSIYYIDSDSVSNSIRYGDYVNDDDRVRPDQIAISHTVLRFFLQLNNIQFVIRGHHDGEHPKLITTSGTPYEVAINKITDIEESAFVTRQGNVNGPVLRIICDNSKWNKYYPVLTLTSAVGAIKQVSYDSLAILRDDISAEQVNEFSNSNIQSGGGVGFLIGGLLNINEHYAKYLKYKNKYLKLKECKH